MAGFFPPLSFDPSDTIEEAFIAPPPNVMENKEILEEAEKRTLYEDFASVGIAPDTYLSLEELVARLRRSRRSYDEEMIRRIFSALSSYSVTGTNYISGRTFIESYMKRRRELGAVLETARGELESVERMLQQAETNLQAIERNPAASMGEESKLTVQVVSVQHLQDASCGNSEGALYKVHLECQQQVIETQPATVRQGSCYMNEVFSFEVSKHGGSLRLCLVRVDPYGGPDELVGDCAVLLEQLADQKKHEMTKEIWGHKGEIVLSCQWIYSRHLLYSTYMREFSVRRDVKLREISDYQIEQDKLNKPFGDNGKATGGLCGAFASGPEYLSKLLDQLRAYLKLSSWMATSQHMAALTLCLSCIAGYTRPVFLDQMIAAFTFWNNIDPRRWTVHRYSFLMICCAVGILYDVWWMRIYFHAWSLTSVEADIHNITKVFTIFLCVWKIVCGNELSTATGTYMPLKVEEPAVLQLASAGPPSSVFLGSGASDH
ncbi:multi-pass transmembrane protein [Besnoitia besnoiti]|uniref:Multi-pass transmembrane protein n=1 Tax=Besnoitia besnoiti TaxID=94643 RepID=A0A2A9MKQ3_BESBE|nr:multi-pass transmembrane protein [Besnoitia besnoiti]PFH36871.1 multi-pass transmembrane protein [Besnoitia besnoiti]